MFNLNYPHTYKDFSTLVEGKYSYMKPVLLLYRDARGEMVTIDSDFVYKNCLEDAWKQGKLGEMLIYVKKLGSTNDGWEDRSYGRGFFNKGREDFGRVSSNVGFGFGVQRQKSWFFA